MTVLETLGTKCSCFSNKNDISKESINFCFNAS